MDESLVDGEKPDVVASALVATIERAWASIISRHPEVPAVVVVVAAGSGGRRGELKLGHFAASRWEAAGGQLPELLVGGEGLRLGALEVLGTLLHEAAHGLGLARSIVNTSRGGRYHNRRYRALAEELGLDVAQVGSIGWSDTSVRPATADAYAGVLADIEQALVLWRRSEPERGRRAGGGSNLAACGCSCEPARRIRAARSTLEAGPILCALCRSPFEVLDDGPALLTLKRQPGDVGGFDELEGAA